MLNHPQLLILDEPFNFLDPSSQNILKQMLTHYNQTTEATLLLADKELEHYFMVGATEEQTEEETEGKAEEETVGKAEEKQEGQAEGKAEERTDRTAEEQP